MNAWWFFGLTLLLEFPVILLFYKEEWRKAILPCLLLNLFTWPLLHYLLWTTDIPINLMEFGIAVVESIGYRLLLKGSWARAFAAGFVANGVSYGAGLLINYYIL